MDVIYLEQPIHSPDQSVRIMCHQPSHRVYQSHINQEGGLSKRDTDDGGWIAEGDLPKGNQEADIEVVEIELGLDIGERHDGG
jgi:hypothetical protein